jgi:hypothetical protein
MVGESWRLDQEAGCGGGDAAGGRGGSCCAGAAGGRDLGAISGWSPAAGPSPRRPRIRRRPHRQPVWRRLPRAGRRQARRLRCRGRFEIMPGWCAHDPAGEAVQHDRHIQPTLAGAVLSSSGTRICANSSASIATPRASMWPSSPRRRSVALRCSSSWTRHPLASLGRTPCTRRCCRSPSRRRPCHPSSPQRSSRSHYFHEPRLSRQHFGRPDRTVPDL